MCVCADGTACPSTSTEIYDRVLKNCSEEATQKADDELKDVPASESKSKEMICR